VYGINIKIKHGIEARKHNSNGLTILNDAVRTEKLNRKISELIIVISITPSPAILHKKGNNGKNATRNPS
jgi:hypothetical protein